jgi:transcriptional regulator with XRE-family HTH domain
MERMTAKLAFGRFITEKRRAAGFTQRELAARLHVTESAISKWERGLSYPDIPLLSKIGTELGVSEQELIRASEDQEGRANLRDAHTYRAWRAAVLWTTLSAYAVAVLTCFIVNLSVEHRLSWFWVVLPAVALAFCLTTLPLLPVPAPGWLSLAGAALSLAVLLTVVWLSYTKGVWLGITLSAVLLALILVFCPIWLWMLKLPQPLRRHLTVFTLAIDTLALLLFLLVVLVSVGMADVWITVAAPIVAVAAAPVWAVALIICYLPVNAWGRAAGVAVVVGISAVAIDRAVAAILGETERHVLNLLSWNADTIATNIQFFIFLLAFTVALVLAAVGTVVARRTRRSAARAADVSEAAESRDFETESL